MTDEAATSVDETESQSTTDEVATEETVATILEQVPDDTSLTVLNTEGEALPLASQETADTIASDYDPIWCPAGQNPTPGENGCTQTFTSFTELLTYLKDHETDQDAALNYIYQAGTIYIQQGDYPAGETEINFNDYDFNQINNHDLTLQGGWDTNYDPAVDGDPTFTNTNFNNISITIGSGTNPWLGSLTINDISIDGVSSQTGLTLYTEGDINLDTVEVSNSQSGADLNAGGDVSVNKSNFNNNKNGGANINAGGGVYVDNSEFNNNGSKQTDGYGVNITSGGETSLYYMSASNNEIYGADVTSGGPVYIDASFFNGNVSLNYGIATSGYGLSVVSQDDITVDAGAVAGEGIEANSNYFFGAYRGEK